MVLPSQLHAKRNVIPECVCVLRPRISVELIHGRRIQLNINREDGQIIRLEPTGHGEEFLQIAGFHHNTAQAPILACGTGILKPPGSMYQYLSPQRGVSGRWPMLFQGQLNPPELRIGDLPSKESPKTIGSIRVAYIETSPVGGTDMLHNLIAALWGLLVPLMGLAANGIPAQRDGIRLDDPLLCQYQEHELGFEDLESNIRAGRRDLLKMTCLFQGYAPTTLYQILNPS